MRLGHCLCSAARLLRQLCISLNDLAFLSGIAGASSSEVIAWVLGVDDHNLARRLAATAAVSKAKAHLTVACTPNLAHACTALLLDANRCKLMQGLPVCYR